MEIPTSLNQITENFAAVPSLMSSIDHLSSGHNSPLTVAAPTYEMAGVDDMLPLPTGLSFFSNLASYGDVEDQPATSGRSQSFPWFSFGSSFFSDMCQSTASTDESAAASLSPPAVNDFTGGNVNAALDLAAQTTSQSVDAEELCAALENVHAPTPLPQFFNLSQMPQMALNSLPAMPSFPQFSGASMTTQLASASAKASAAGVRIGEAFSSTVKRAQQAMSLLPPIPKRVKSTSKITSKSSSASSSSHEGKIDSHSKPRTSQRRPRTREQLDKCRQESARARDRKRQERARLDAFVSGKTREAELLQEQICTLEAELHYLRQHVVRNALVTLQQQPAARASQFAGHVVAYVTQLLQSGAAALKFIPPALGGCSTPSVTGQITNARQIRPRPSHEGRDGVQMDLPQ